MEASSGQKLVCAFDCLGRQAFLSGELFPED